MPLLYRHVAALQSLLPEGVWDRLRPWHGGHLRYAYQATEELLRVFEEFDHQGIPGIPFKGPALSHQLYGDVALRQYSDLDILVRGADLRGATAAMLRMGYRRESPLHGKRASASRRSTVHEIFIRGPSDPPVEIHWDLLPRCYSVPLDLDSLWDRRRSFSLGGREVASFAPEDLFLILCLHAWKHQYERLAWLVDLAELAGSNPGLDWERMSEQVGRWRMRRIWSLSLFLMKELLDAPIPREVNGFPECRSVQAVGDYVLEFSMNRAEGEKISIREELPYCLAMRECWKDRLRYLIRKGWIWMTPTSHEWLLVPLPDRFFFLYYFLRPLRLVAKYGRKML